ncbi:MAG: ABC transporter permease [Planctomycetia bacterium]|nr:MAG: ABC transporter permease [Planctomycetia bacterium]
MRRVVTVAVREFLETVRTKAFILSVVFMPGLIVAGMYGSTFVDQVSRAERVAARTIALVTDIPGVAESLTGQLAVHTAQNPNRPLHLMQLDHDEAGFAAAASRAAAAVQDESAYAYVLLPREVLDGQGAAVVGRRDQQVDFGRRLSAFINEAVISARFAALSPPLDRGHVLRLEAPVTIETRSALTGEPLSGGELARLLTPFAFMFMMMIGIFGVSQGLLTSVIEEKSSRIMEVLLSAVSPTELMAGKVLGVSAVGLILMMAWGGAAYYSATQSGMGYLVGDWRLLYAALYFLPGFLMAAGILGAIGAACNELREAQSMAFPLSVINLVPMLFWWFIVEHPQSLISTVLSFIPPITPLIMMLRVCSDPHTPVWQIVATLGLLWVSVVAAIWAAGRIFRVGVLMYGKPPTPSELLRWLRTA